MINTFGPAATAFVEFFDNMPVPIKTFVFLCVGLYAITAVVHIIFR